MKIIDKDGLKAVSDLLINYFDTDVSEAMRLNISARIISKYFQIVDAKPRKNKHNLLPATLALANMKVGEKVEFEPTAHQTMRSRMKTARIIAGNSRMRWLCRNVGCYTVVTRDPDSGLAPRRRYDPRDNPRAVFLANIPLDESKMAPTELFPVYGGSIDTSVKIQARKILDNSSAKWHQRRTTKGIRIWRDL